MGKFTEYKLPLKSMPVGTQAIEYKIGKQFFTNMENSDVRDADLEVKLTVVHKNDFYDLTFDITGAITVACDRCLDDLVLPVETSYHIIVKYGEDYNDESDDFLIIPESDNYLNIAYMLYDTIVLAIPARHVHGPGKCNRAMSSLLKKHRAPVSDPEDAVLEEGLIDEMDSLDDAGDANAPSDPRWDKLRDFSVDD